MSDARELVGRTDEEARDAARELLHAERAVQAEALRTLQLMPKTRATSLAITKIEEARMWLGVAAFEGG